MPVALDFLQEKNATAFLVIPGIEPGMCHHILFSFPVSMLKSGALGVFVALGHHAINFSLDIINCQSCFLPEFTFCNQLV